MTQIARDPFARESLHRRREYLIFANQSCQWCGQRKQTKTGRPFLYAYRVEHDGGREYDIRGMFCSVQCMRIYWS